MLPENSDQHPRSADQQRCGKTTQLRADDRSMQPVDRRAALKTADTEAGDSGDPSTERQHLIEEIVDKYHGLLFGFAYRLTGNRAEAEDVTQQTLLLAVRNVGQVRDPIKIKSWLMVTLKNCFLKSGRRKRPQAESNLEIRVDQLACYSPPTEPVDGEALQLALNRLSDEHRIILNMYYFEQLSYLEIASILEVKVGTVMSRLSRAKSRLRGILIANREDENE